MKIDRNTKADILGEANYLPEKNMCFEKHEGNDLSKDAAYYRKQMFEL